MELIITLTGLAIIIIILICLIPKIKTYNQRKNIEKIKHFHKNVYTKESPYGGTYGRGIFAKKDFKPNEIIDVSTYIEDDKENITGILLNYVFFDENKPNKRYIGFGSAPLFNFSKDNNAEYFIDDNHTLIVIKARKHIKADEEIFLPFNRDYIDKYF